MTPLIGTFSPEFGITFPECDRKSLKYDDSSIRKGDSKPLVPYAACRTNEALAYRAPTTRDSIAKDEGHTNRMASLRVGRHFPSHYYL